MQGNGWYKKGVFWGFLEKGVVRQLCLETGAGLFVMAPHGHTIAIGFIFKGGIAEYKKALEITAR